MPLKFNSLLRDSGLDLREVRLLRHQSTAGDRISPFALWQRDVSLFEAYQEFQDTERRAYFNSPYWASFVGLPDGRTLFVGLYSSRLTGPLTDAARIHPLTGEPLRPEGRDLYETARMELLSEFIGRLYIDWGAAARAWVQRADNQDKTITELHTVFREPGFPGYAAFVSRLSEIAALPAGWVQALRAQRGIYLLTCPRTREQYVGSASGADGFWGRWLEYVSTGHGGNIELKSRDPADYQVSILDTVPFSATVVDILEKENLWKAKLQSREMGLNRN